MMFSSTTSFCCPYCERLDFQDEDHYFEHVCECQDQFADESLEDGD